MAGKPVLQLVQGLPTSGARAVESFVLDGFQYLAIPQLAEDIPGSPAGMNLGDSDVPLIIYRASKSSEFEEVQRLPVPGGEDAEFFAIGDRHFLATASLRSGKGPYNMDVESIIFEWKSNQFVEFQRIPTFAAKQWRYVHVARRHFLALAQGVVIPGVISKIPTDSTIFEWNGASFEPFQTVPSKWGYNWLHFELEGDDFLAYADHLEPSILMKWNGDQFALAQSFDGTHGRAFSFFKDNAGAAYLAFARISSDSVLYRWQDRRFQIHQTLPGHGGREFALVKSGYDTFLFHVRFITGSREDPNPELESAIYRLEKGQLELSARFTTLGGTDVRPISISDQTWIVVAESLNKEHRFRTDTHIYRFQPESRSHHKVDGVAPFQSPELINLFTTYTASPNSVGSRLTAIWEKKTALYPLLAATGTDILIFPGSGAEPSYINFRLATRGFKELAAISHLGPALASLVQMNEDGAESDDWQNEARRLLESIVTAQEANSIELWRDQIQAEAFRGREAAISAMVDYTCRVTRKYLQTVLTDPTKLTAEFLRKEYLEATGDALGATVPINCVMIATFFLVGLDISYRIRTWLSQYHVDWKNAMVLLVGRQGRVTSGVTLGTNAVAQMILHASDLQLPVERIYIAPHGPQVSIVDPDNVDAIRKYEKPFRALWNAVWGISRLGETMFAGYPAYRPESNIRPTIVETTTVVSELPKIHNPNDWFAMNTRMRVVLEDARQLLSSCVTDYAAEQLRLSGADLSKVVVPGLDRFESYTTSQLTNPPKDAKSVSGLHDIMKSNVAISSCPFPIPTDIPAPIQQFVANGGLLAFRESGPGHGKSILWIHGLPLDSRSWAAQYGRFTERYHNIFVDLRGYGSSSKLPSTVQDVTQLYCDDLLALMDHLSLPRASIVGFASAAHAAMRFAAQQPDRVTSLILLNGSPRFRRNTSDYPFGFSEEQVAYFNSAADTGGIKGITDAVLDPSLVFQELSASDAGEIIPWFRSMSHNAGVDTLRGFFKHMVNDDDRHLVPSIRAPTLLLSASLGKEVPSETARWLRNHIQHSMLIELPDSDHFFFATRPVLVNELIDGFLARLEDDT